MVVGRFSHMRCCFPLPLFPISLFLCLSLSLFLYLLLSLSLTDALYLTPRISFTIRPNVLVHGFIFDRCRLSTLQRNVEAQILWPCMVMHTICVTVFNSRMRLHARLHAFTWCLSNKILIESGDKMFCLLFSSQIKKKLQWMRNKKTIPANIVHNSSKHRTQFEAFHCKTVNFTPFVIFIEFRLWNGW